MGETTQHQEDQIETVGIESRDEQNKTYSIGGFLILFVFSLLLNIFLAIKDIYVFITLYDPDVYYKNLEFYSPIFKLIILGLTIYSLFLLIKKRKRLLVVIKTFFTVLVIGSIIDVILLYTQVSGIPELNGSQTTINYSLTSAQIIAINYTIASSLYVVCGVVWFLYFIYSKRVKNTFIN